MLADISLICPTMRFAFKRILKFFWSRHLRCVYCLTPLTRCSRVAISPMRRCARANLTLG